MDTYFTKKNIIIGSVVLVLVVIVMIVLLKKEKYSENRIKGENLNTDEKRKEYEEKRKKRPATTGVYLCCRLVVCRSPRPLRPVLLYARGVLSPLSPLA